MSVIFALLILFAVAVINAELFSASLVEKIRNCLSDANTTMCLKQEALTKLDNALRDNSSWHLNEFISLEKDPMWNTYSSSISRSSAESDWKSKLSHLIKSRFLKVQMPNNLVVEGRKKKFKGGKGGYAMMGGMAVMGLMVQMVIGKLFLLAGAAFILSKIALMYSILSSFKKSGGSSTDHVIYADAGGSNSDHGSSWHRSATRNFPVDPYEYAYKQNNL